MKVFALTLITLLFFVFSANAQIESIQKKISTTVTTVEDSNILKPGDVIEINIEGYKDYNHSAMIDKNGYITYKSLGKIRASGLTVSQFEEKIGDLLKPYVSDPQVKVIVKSKEYVLKIGDILDIKVVGHEDYNYVTTIEQDGKISYKSFERIDAEGLTIFQLQNEIANILQPYITRPQIKVTVMKKEYVIKPGDVINITVEGHDDYNYTTSVDQSGKIIYKHLGEIDATGLTVSQLEQKIKESLSTYIKAPKLKVSVKQQGYIIEPGDIIKIVVEGNEDYSQTTYVRKDGNIFYNKFGNIMAAGLSPTQLEEQIKIKLTNVIKDPKVNIIVEKAEMPLEKVSELPIPMEKKQRLININDVIEIIVRNHGEYNFITIVQDNGKIMYPPLGYITSVGLTDEELSQNISSRLSGYISNPQIIVKIKGSLDFRKFDTIKQADYIIKPGNVIKLIVEGRDNYNQMMVVQPSGKVYHSELGWIVAIGLTAENLNQRIKSILSAGIKTPQISVVVMDFQSTDDLYIEVSQSSKRFGLDFFISAKNRILNLEKNGQPTDFSSPEKSAISGFVGPMDMVSSSVQATVPPRYILGPGDRITVNFWSDVVELQTETLVVDNNGEVVIPKTGRIMVVRGMTLSQFEEAVRNELSRVAFKNPKVVATLDKLRSIQIFIAGEAFRPGSYAISAVTTLFNALYLCGGPSDNGTLRNIKLLRNNETKTIDFYKFLMNGDSSQDYELLPGDTILIPMVEKVVTIGGEVKRPSVYELLKDETLKDLISLAGGIRPTGSMQRVRIDSVVPGTERVILDIDISSQDKINKEIYDGDSVTVFSIPSERMNTVTVEGKVRAPGIYQLKEGMKISDLINAAIGLSDSAYMKRADLIRFNKDKKTTTLIPINLSNALLGDSSDNIVLQQWDKLVVYSEWDIRWIGNRTVSVIGAVQKPGSYVRSDGMTIYDLLISSGGILPNAYSSRAYLMRLDERGDVTQSITIDLDKVMEKDASANLELKDGDTLLVYTYREARWEPERSVIITGAVQNPNKFTRTDGMKISDLIHIAGGLLPNAYHERALLLRMDEKWMVTQGIFINLKLAIENDPKNNLELKDGDQLKVYTYEESGWKPKREVTVSGAVLNSGTFERVDDMHVSDLIKRAGGLLPNAYLQRADIKRFRPDYETYITVPVDLSRAISEDKSADIMLEDGDQLYVFTIREAEYKPQNIVTIYGAVQRPDTYTRTYNMKLSDLLFTAGGVIPGAYKLAEISRIDKNGKSTVLIADIDALLKGDNSQDVLLEDEDVISIRKQKDFLDKLRIVRIEGEVKYPGSYALKQNERLIDLIQRAGGLTDRAFPDGAVVTRRIGNIIFEEQRRVIEQVKRLFSDLSEQEYQRETVKAMISKESIKREEKPVTESPLSLATSSAVSSITEAAKLEAAATVPEQTKAVFSGIEDIARYYRVMVTPAREIGSYLPPGRINISLKEALKQPNSKDNIILEDGDMIIVPAMIPTISITGAVIQPSSIVYVQGKKLSYYIDQVGGFSKDADKDAAYVIKANGLVIKGDKAKLAPGDLIVVPTKVMVTKVTDRWGQMISLIKFTVTTIAMVYSVKIILGRI